MEQASQPSLERRVSHYRVGVRLAGGGMGEVYSGVDETLNRRVALKSIRPEHRLNAHSKTRFLREAQILSSLDHPNICRVYDYIEADDSDWLVLELVDGKTLRAAIDQGLEPAVRMKIAEQIATVLVVTHAAGVIHRDLKPGNVMIARDGNVKVLDFGLARSLVPGVARTVASAGDALLFRPAPGDWRDANADAITEMPTVAVSELTQFQTEHGAIMGTVGYMSPEQASGEVATAASDMYSFGLLLQELFTGKRPYDSELDYASQLAKARLADTPPVSGIDADLASLIQRLKALAPSQRPTATETADRLLWIHRKPKRRARALVIAAAIVLLAAGGLKYTVDLARERTAAVAARQEADRRREQAESLIGFMLGDLRRKLKPVGRLEILDDVGAKAMEYFRAVPEKQLTDTELLRRSTALYQIGSVRIDQGRLEAATQPLQESLALATALSAHAPNDTSRLFELGQSQYWVGFVHWRRRNLDEALKHFHEYLAISEKLVSLSPSNNSWQLELSYANSNIGSVLQERGDLAAALEKFQACVRIRERLLAAAPDNNTFRRALAASNNTAAVVLESMGRLDDSLKLHRAELALQQELVQRDPNSVEWQMFLATATNYVGVILEAQGMEDAAADRYRTAIGIFDALVRRDSSNATWQRALGRNHFRLGRTLIATDVHAAERELQRAVDILGGLAGSDQTNAGWRRDLAEARHGRGEARLAAGDLEGAAVDAHEALALANAALEQSAGDRDAARLRALGLLLQGAVDARRGNQSAVVESCRRALDAIEPVAHESSDYRYLAPWAGALSCTGRRDEAQRVVERLNAIRYRNRPAPPAGRGTTLRQPSTIK